MFRSFYLAGFECATGYNRRGEWIDQIAATEHDLHVDADYGRLTEVGIHAVREAMRWPIIDRRGRYDFSSVEPFVDAALRHELDVIWDLFHFGYPDEVDPFSAHFAERLAEYCHAAADFVRRRMQRSCYFTPVNEPSYFAWAAGEAGLFAPHTRGRGFELKVSLARAALRAIAAIRDACPQARIVNVDPICRVAPASDTPEAFEHAQCFNEQWVYEFWDIVAGRIMPELGGSPEALDIVGLNYYWTNQWQIGQEGTPLAANDPRRVPLGELVRATWRRYGREILITETSALGEARAAWIHELSEMAETLLDEGVALQGICLYPILGMPEWHARAEWARMGLWDLEREQHALERKVCLPMLQALRAAQRRRPRAASLHARALTVQPTAAPAIAIYGRTLWQSAAEDALYRLTLIRSDEPYRLWMAVIELRAGSDPLTHACTAATLALLIEQLQWMTPARIADCYGSAQTRALRFDLDAWREELHAIASRAARLETESIEGSRASSVITTARPIGGGRA